jgi:hypothetical protein
MTLTEAGRWLLRILIPSAMFAWGMYEVVRIWNAGWLWHGVTSVIAFTVGLAGLAWLVEDGRLLYKRLTGG